MLISINWIKQFANNSVNAALVKGCCQEIKAIGIS